MQKLKFLKPAIPLTVISVVIALMLSLVNGEPKVLTLKTMLEKYLESINIEDQFVKYAEDVDKIKASRIEWEESREYMMPQIKGLVGRYSKLGEEAFYRFYMPVDENIRTALENKSVVE